MATILGIESTAHTFGIGVVRGGKILANVRDLMSTESGGIIPIEAAKHHARVSDEIYSRALAGAGIEEKEIDAVAFSQGPGLAPCLIEGMKFTKALSRRLEKPVIPVNHCIAHQEIGRIVGVKDPVMLYTSGANTQVIAYASGRYRVFGETLDLGVGNFIDTFARYLGLGFPGGPKIQNLAEQSSEKNYVELPYTVKGMDIALSGILTNLRQKIERINLKNSSGKISTTSPLQPRDFARESISDLSLPRSRSPTPRKVNDKPLRRIVNKIDYGKKNSLGKKVINYAPVDLAYSMQETVFAMLVEVAERALAYTGKKELLLAGGVACNSRLQEMCSKMCSDRIEKTKLFVPCRDLLVDNGAMIAYAGEVLFNSGIKTPFDKLDEIDIKPRQRTDDVEVSWK